MKFLFTNLDFPFERTIYSNSTEIDLLLGYQIMYNIFLFDIFIEHL